MKTEKLLTPEEWLKEYCQLCDWDEGMENLNDYLHTSNVLIYMENYMKYVNMFYQSQRV